MSDKEYEDEIAKAVGYICIRWADLESYLNALLILLLGLKQDDFKYYETISHNIDFREKIKIIAGLGFHKTPHEDWFDILKWALDKIDNNLRGRRNRKIHDRLIIDSEGILQIQAKTGFRKPQSRQLEHFSKITHETDIPEIQELNEEIQNMCFTISILTIAVMDGHYEWREQLLEQNLLPPHLIKQISR